jgi:protein-histidine pros-kinase
MKRLRAERRIASRIAAFLDAAPDAMMVIGRDGRILAANTHAVTLFGYGAAELIGLPVERLVPEQFRRGHEAHRQRYADDPHPRPMGAELELSGLRKDGSEFPVEISLSPLETATGRMTIAAIRDSSSRRRNEAQFRGLLEAAPDAMIVAARDGRIRLVNTQTERLFGYRRDELLGQPIEMLMPERYAAIHPSHREVYASNPRPRPMGHELELFGKRKDGTEFPVEISLSPLETGEGMLITSAVRDVTDRKRLEEDVRRQNRELEEQNQRVQKASRMKSEFLANMSHELRTPLNSVIGFAELMHDGHLGPMADNHREYLGDILTSARQLLRLINDVLDLSKVESGMMEFFPEPVNLPALVGAVADMVRPLASAKNIRIDEFVSPDVSHVVLDPEKLKQVIANYVSNAVKFTNENGRIEIRALSHGASHVRVEVEDTGVGIRRQDLERLFVEFQQLDAGSAKRYQGTGLGLALTKRIVEAQGGHVGVSSEFGRGSLFHAILPREATPSRAHRPSHKAPIVHTPGSPARILVVDDNAAALRLVETALTQHGFAATCVDNPALGLSIARESFDLIIVDLVMPTFRGERFLKELRELPGCEDIPVIVWTVLDLTPVQRAHVLKLATAIVAKGDGGVTALVNRVRTFVEPDPGAPPR